MSKVHPVEHKGPEMAYSWTCPACGHPWISVLRKPALCTCGYSRIAAEKRERNRQQILHRLKLRREALA